MPASSPAPPPTRPTTGPTATPTATPTALLVTRDDLLLDDLLRVVAAAGVAAEVAHDPGSALRAWGTAAVVLVGTDLAGGVAEQRPPRRAQVHVVGPTPTPDAVFRHAVVLGASDVVELPAAEAWLVELVTDVGDVAGPRSRGGRTVGVLGGSGGVGASTFAAALGLVSAGHQPTALLDLDPLGAGLDRVVGLEAPDGPVWDTLHASRGRLGSRSLREALPTKDGLGLLTWGVTAPAVLDAGVVREVLSAARRGHELVLLDLPRSLDDVGAEVVTRCDHLLLVVGSSVAALASAGRLLGGLRALTSRLELVVRRDAGAVPPEAVADALGIQVRTVLPQQRRLQERVELGLGPVHTRRSGLARAARTTLTWLAAEAASASGSAAAGHDRGAA